MGRKSTRENKNIYQLSREANGFTREDAAELMEFVSDDRIEKIESERSLPHPDEILAMSKCYKDPTLCNYFCSHECPIGQESVPEVKLKDLSQIVLEILASLNSLDHEKNRLIEITADGEITDDEYDDFKMIQERLDQISLSVDSMKMWLQKTIAEGKIDQSILE